MHFLEGGLFVLVFIPLVSGQCSTCLEKKCYDHGECIIGCVPGYVGEYCEEECPPRCANKDCYRDRDKGTVTCTDGCEQGYCGSKCNLACDKNCVTCDRQCGSCNVTICPERRYGAACNRVCKPKYDKCDRATGQCIRCIRHYFGNDCNQTCKLCLTRENDISDKCLSGCDKCRIHDACPQGFHGDSCDLKCSPGCDNPGSCNKATEECSNGCVSGFHGSACNVSCDRFCVRKTCHQHDSLCIYGCISGYRSTKSGCVKFSNDVSGIYKTICIVLGLLVAVMMICALISGFRRLQKARGKHVKVDIETGSTDSETDPLLIDETVKAEQSTDSETDPLVIDETVKAEQSTDSETDPLLIDETVKAEQSTGQEIVISTTKEDRSRSPCHKSEILKQILRPKFIEVDKRKEKTDVQSKRTRLSSISPYSDPNLNPGIEKGSLEQGTMFLNYLYANGTFSFNVLQSQKPTSGGIYRQDGNRTTISNVCLQTLKNIIESYNNRIRKINAKRSRQLLKQISETDVETQYTGDNVRRTNGMIGRYVGNLILGCLQEKVISPSLQGPPLTFTIQDKNAKNRGHKSGRDVLSLTGDICSPGPLPSSLSSPYWKRDTEPPGKKNDCRHLLRAVEGMGNSVSAPGRSVCFSNECSRHPGRFCTFKLKRDSEGKFHQDGECI